MWGVIESAVKAADPTARVHPGLIVGGTDARYYRPHGATVYGAGIFSPSIDMADFGSRFHGNNERIDLESLRRATNDRWDTFTKAIQTGILSIDEVRALEGLPALPDGKGETHYIPLNLAPVGTQTVEEVT